MCSGDVIELVGEGEKAIIFAAIVVLSTGHGGEDIVVGLLIPQRFMLCREGHGIGSWWRSAWSMCHCCGEVVDSGHGCTLLNANEIASGCSQVPCSDRSCGLREVLAVTRLPWWHRRGVVGSIDRNWMCCVLRFAGYHFCNVEYVDRLGLLACGFGARPGYADVAHACTVSLLRYSADLVTQVA